MVRKAHDESLQNEEEALSVVPITENYIAKTQRLCDVIFGSRYATISMSDTCQFTLVGFYGNKLVGFGAGIKLKTGVYRNFKLSDNPIGILHLVGVDPGYRNRGIGIGIMQRIVEELRPLEIYGFAWENKGDVIAHTRLVSVGLKRIDRLKNHWRSDCDKGKFQCPSRTEVCTCVAVLYSSK